MRTANTDQKEEDGALALPGYAYGAGLLVHTRAVMLAKRMTDKDARGEPGRTFVYWLSQACKSAREAGGLLQRHIPAEQSRVSRFEKKAVWPDDPEELVQCYAQALKIKDSRMLWAYAVELWLEHGRPPKRVTAPSQVPGIPEGELLQRLRADPPTDQGRQQRKSRRADGQSGS